MKHAKRAFLASVLAVVLCITSLVGTTFAWFTDSVTSGGNRIISGTLKVDLLMYKNDAYTSIAGGSGDLFTEAAVAQNSNATLWEPGKTQVVYLKVENKGNLALKYNILLDIRDTDVSDTVHLGEVLDYAIIDGATNETAFTSWDAVKTAATSPIATIGTAIRASLGVTELPSIARVTAAPNGRLAAAESDCFALAVHMQEGAGNEYQDKGIVLDVTVVATQATVEEDSFDDQYDALAGFPAVAYAMNTQAGTNFDVEKTTDTVIRDALAVSTVPAETDITTADDTVYNSNSSGILNRTITSDTQNNEIAYDISYSYTTTTTDAETGVTTSKTEAVSVFSNIVVNELNIGKDLKIIKVTHSHEGADPVVMSELASASENAVGYYYDHESGILTIKSDTYSVFTLEFDKKVAVSSLSVDPTDVTINVYESTNVVGTVLPDEATYKTITWTSSDPSTISVDQNGAVTAHKPGTVTITATADGVASGNSCTVTAVADAVRGGTYYVALQDALDAAQANETVTLLRNVSCPATVTGVNNVTLDMNNFAITQTSTSSGAYALRLYDCDTITVKNGTINGRIRIGEHHSAIIKWKHLNYGDDLYESVSGYHPLAPATNILMQDLNVNAGSQEAFFFTNIEDDLTRGASSNYCDNDLYGHYIYKTGYLTSDQYVNNQKSEVFTACNKTDSVTVSGGTFSGAKFAGNMVTFGGDRIEGVLIAANGVTTSSDAAGRFVVSGSYLVGTTSSSFVVTDSAPLVYTAQTGSVYYTYAGGANDAIEFATIGETVTIAENADAVKEIAQGESFTVVSLSDDVSWTGARVTSKVENPENYEVVVSVDDDNPLRKTYSVKFSVVARVYHVGDTRKTPTATTSYDEYGSLLAAVQAAGTGDYVKLMKDTTITAEQTISGSYKKYGINLSARMVLDLNGYTYTYTGAGTAIICTANTGTDGGQRAIRDTSEGKTGTVYATKGCAFAKYNQKSDKTVIYDGNFVSAKDNAIWIKDAFNIEIQGGTFRSLANNASVGIGYGTIKTFTISGGTFSSNPSSISKATIASGKTVVDNGDGTWTVK